MLESKSADYSDKSLKRFFYDYIVRENSNNILNKEIYSQINIMKEYFLYFKCNFGLIYK